MPGYTDSSRRYDGNASFIRGMDGRRANIIGEDQYALGINVVCRDGSLRTRPPFDKVALTFEEYTDEQRFQTGRFQGAGFYSPGTGWYAICAVQGHLYLVDLVTGNVTDYQPIIGDLNEYTRISTEQADRYFIVQDGVTGAVIFDGLAARRAEVGTVPNPAWPANPPEFVSEVPTGTHMVYGQKRLYLVQGNGWIAGDIREPTDASTLLRFSEHLYLNEGGPVVLDANLGPIRGMAMLPEVDSGTGVGPLVVCGERAVMAYNVRSARQDWNDSETEFGRAVLLDTGGRSHESMVQRNNDLFWHADEGVRALRQARAQYESYGNTPFSREMDPVMARNTPELSHLVSACAWDNRLFVTVGQKQITVNDSNGDPINDWYFDGLAVLDFNPASSTRQRNAPAWEGVWTGFFPTAVFSGHVADEHRLYAFGRENRAVNTLWVCNPAGRLDDGSARIESVVHTRAYILETAFNQKRIGNCDLWYTLLGTVDFDARLKLDKAPGWTDWRSWTDTAPASSFPPAAYYPQLRAGFQLGHVPDTVASPASGMLTDHGFEAQLRLYWKGYAEVDRIRFGMNVEDERSTRDIIPVRATAGNTVGPIDEYGYNIAMERGA